jgi:hypothetical protein
VRAWWRGRTRAQRFSMLIVTAFAVLVAAALGPALLTATVDVQAPGEDPRRVFEGPLT